VEVDSIPTINVYLSEKLYVKLSTSGEDKSKLIQRLLIGYFEEKEHGKQE